MIIGRAIGSAATILRLLGKRNDSVENSSQVK